MLFRSGVRLQCRRERELNEVDDVELVELRSPDKVFNTSGDLLVVGVVLIPLELDPGDNGDWGHREFGSMKVQ